MGFKEIRSQIIECLSTGKVQHAGRRQINEKNMLLTGDISVEEVTLLLKRVKGTEYECSPHHQIPGLEIHVFKPTLRKGRGVEHWYIKCYLVNPDVWFISVHRSEK